MGKTARTLFFFLEGGHPMALLKLGFYTDLTFPYETLDVVVIL